MDRTLHGHIMLPDIENLRLRPRLDILPCHRMIRLCRISRAGDKNGGE